MKGRCVTLVRSCRLTGARERGAGVHTSAYLPRARRGENEEAGGRQTFRPSSEHARPTLVHTLDPATSNGIDVAVQGCTAGMRPEWSGSVWHTMM